MSRLTNWSPAPAEHRAVRSAPATRAPALRDVEHLSDAFAGLVVVAIAGNAVENVVGIPVAARNQADYVMSVILQSPLQIALVVAPVLVLAAPLVGVTFTLVLSPRSSPR